MKILIVHYYQGFHGGAEEVVVQLDRYLKAQDHEVRVVMGSSPIRLLWEVRRSLDWCDVVNIHNFPATLTTFPICSKPQVWLCNEPPELFTSWWKGWAEALSREWVRRSNMTVVVASHFDAGRFLDIYSRTADYVIPYGVDYEYWSQLPSIAGAPDGMISLLHVGCLCRYKRQLESLRVLKELKELGIPAYLILAGPEIKAEMSYLHAIKTYINDNNLDSHVYLTGNLSPEKLRGLYHTSNLLLHPVDSQGGWLVAFEAMCAGLPVITSSQFPAADLIIKNKLGVVTENYVGAIRWKDYETFNTTRIKEWVRDNLTWEKFGERMVEVFEAARGRTGT